MEVEAYRNEKSRILDWGFNLTFRDSYGNLQINEVTVGNIAKWLGDEIPKLKKSEMKLALRYLNEDICKDEELMALDRQLGALYDGMPTCET